jgi:hypothetical protein
MKSEEIFKKTVEVMKQLLTPQGMKDAIKRARERGDGKNAELLQKERGKINELVRTIADRRGDAAVLQGVPAAVVDAMVLRYLRNREIFMKTFPDGIEGIDTDPVSTWAAIMISPVDDPGEDS